MEPAADLGIIAAVVSSVNERPVPGTSAFFGEISLTGELRAVGQTELRLREAARLGFTTCTAPASGLSSITVPDGMEVCSAQDLAHAMNCAGLMAG